MKRGDWGALKPLSKAPSASEHVGAGVAAAFFLQTDLQQCNGFVIHPVQFPK